jgi:hypothetical protein
MFGLAAADLLNLLGGSPIRALRVPQRDSQGCIAVSS